MISRTQPLGTPGKHNASVVFANLKGDPPATVTKPVPPERVERHINPSVEDTNITPGTDPGK